MAKEDIKVSEISSIVIFLRQELRHFALSWRSQTMLEWGAVQTASGDFQINHRHSHLDFTRHAGQTLKMKTNLC